MKTKSQQREGHRARREKIWEESKGKRERVLRLLLVTQDKVARQRWYIRHQDEKIKKLKAENAVLRAELRDCREAE